MLPFAATGLPDAQNRNTQGMQRRRFDRWGGGTGVVNLIGCSVIYMVIGRSIPVHKFQP